MANRAMLAVVSSRTRLTVWVSGSRRARARIRGPSVVGPGLLRVDAAVPDPVVELGEDHVGAVDLVADGGEVLPDRAEFGTPVVAYLSSRAACGWSG